MSMPVLKVILCTALVLMLCCAALIGAATGHLLLTVAFLGLQAGASVLTIAQMFKCLHSLSQNGAQPPANEPDRN